MRGAEAGIQILLEVRPEVDLIERIGTFALFPRRLFAFGFLPGHVVQHGNGIVQLLKHGIFRDLGLDHVLELDFIERKDGHHLHQPRRQDLALGDPQTQFGLERHH